MKIQLNRTSYINANFSVCCAFNPSITEYNKNLYKHGLEIKCYFFYQQNEMAVKKKRMCVSVPVQDSPQVCQ